MKDEEPVLIDEERASTTWMTWRARRLRSQRAAAAPHLLRRQRSDRRNAGGRRERGAAHPPLPADHARSRDRGESGRDESRRGGDELPGLDHRRDAHGRALVHLLLRTTDAAAAKGHGEDDRGGHGADPQAETRLPRTRGDEDPGRRAGNRKCDGISEHGASAAETSLSVNDDARADGGVGPPAQASRRRPPQRAGGGARSTTWSAKWSITVAAGGSACRNSSSSSEIGDAGAAKSSGPA